MALVEVTKQDHIGIITMNRPEALNALSKAVFADLSTALDEVERDDDIYVVVITGAGRAFIAGADIGEMATMNVEEGLNFSELGNNLLMRVDMFPKPTIAAVNGFALGGGCELAMSCDIILASEKAKFGQPEVGLGITPGFSGTQRLPRRVGIAKAKELTFSGKMITAEEAKEIGLANAVYAPEELLNAAKEMANSFLKNSPVAVKYAKVCIDRGMQLDIDSAIALENEMFALCYASPDQKEGMTAFLEKRPAVFQ